jgi:ribosome recycling factor
MSADINSMKGLMEKAIQHLKTEFSKMRVGRANASMIDTVLVEAYGSKMALKEVASLTTPDSKTITIQPWDATLIGEIERGILGANLGLTPINDGKLIRINLPQMTEERRKEFVKQIKKYGEDAKVALRTHRRDTIDGAKKSKEMSEDDQRRFQEEVQKMTDRFSAQIDELVESKSKELMTL